jgi:peptidoglycan L-alanyl-D-glutamate endopeptidase CwlK
VPKFSQTSARRLAECDERLQRVFSEVIKHVDCTVLCGHRSKEEQDAAYKLGNSKLKFPMSKHNRLPALAVDVVPYPVDWNNIRHFDRFSGFVFGIARGMGVELRWGGDWDRDWDLKDNRFNDLPHFELVED